MKYKILTACLGLALFGFGLSPSLANAQGGCCVITVDDDELGPNGNATSFDITIFTVGFPAPAGITVAVPVALGASDDTTSIAIFAALTGAGFTVSDETLTTCIVTGLRVAGAPDDPVTGCTAVVTAANPAPVCQRIGMQFVATPPQGSDPIFEVFDVDHLGTPPGAGGTAPDVEGGVLCGANPAAGAGGTITTACGGAVGVAGMDDNAASTAVFATLPAGSVRTPVVAGPGADVPSIVIPWTGAVCMPGAANAAALPLGLDLLWAGIPGQGDLITKHIKAPVPALSAFGAIAFLLLATGGYFIRKRRARA